MEKIDFDKTIKKFNIIYTPKREESIKLYELTKKCMDKNKIHVNENILERINNCSEIMCYDLNEKGKIFKRFSCKDKFCAICQRDETIKMTHKLIICSKYLIQEQNKALILLTLELPACDKDELNYMLDVLTKSYRHMTRLKRMKAMHKGSYRKNIIKYDEINDKYYLSMKVIIAVTKSYFKNRNYISRKEWEFLWKQAVENITKKEVNQGISAISKKINENDLENEIFNFCNLPNVEFYNNEEVYSVLRKAIKNRQLANPLNIFIEVFDKYENGELDYIKYLD